MDVQTLVAVLEERFANMQKSLEKHEASDEANMTEIKGMFSTLTTSVSNLTNQQAEQRGERRVMIWVAGIASTLISTGAAAAIHALFHVAVK